MPSTDLSKHASALKTHILDLSKYYLSKNILRKMGVKVKDKDNENENENNDPAITIINLIDKNGSQGKLGEKMKLHMA